MSKQVGTAALTAFLAAAIEASGKTQRQIADECGYNRPNVVSMIKNGDIDLPIGKVKVFAECLGLSEFNLMSMLLKEKYPEIWASISDVIGRRILSPSEAELLDFLRDEAKTNKLAPETEREKELLRGYATTVSARLSTPQIMQDDSDAGSE